MENMYFFEGTQIENANCCPICRSKKRELKYEHVKDYFQKQYLNSWTIVSCENCRSLYLSVRPKEEFIGLAYHVYYTHTSNGLKSKIKNYILLHCISIYLQNFKINFLKKTLVSTTNILTFGWIDSKLRNIQICKQPIKTLLDVGCGNGDFLHLLKYANIDCLGIDFDKNAVDAAVRRGINAKHLSLESLRIDNTKFDVITSGHVLEHLYNPHKFFENCNLLLNDGGVLWLQVPNSESSGLRIFGKFWRGLEAPRHITIPSAYGLNCLAEQYGFELIKSPINYSASFFTSTASAKAQLKYIRHNNREPYSAKCLIPFFNFFKLIISLKNLNTSQEFLTQIYIKVK